MQVTLEKSAVLDPVFDTFDAVGAYEEVGDTVPGEAKLLVRMHASLLWIICIQYLYTSMQYLYTCKYVYVCSISICAHIYIYIYVCIKIYMDFEICQSVIACNLVPPVMYACIARIEMYVSTFEGL